MPEMELMIRKCKEPLTWENSNFWHTTSLSFHHKVMWVKHFMLYEIPLQMFVGFVEFHRCMLEEEY